MRFVSIGRGQRSPNLMKAIGGYVSTPGPNELNGRPLPSVTSRARTTRRAIGRLHLGRRSRVERHQLTMQRLEAFFLGVLEQCGVHIRPAAGHFHRVGDAAQVQARAGDEHGAIVARFDRP